MIGAFVDGLRRIGRAPWLVLGLWLWMLVTGPSVQGLTTGGFSDTRLPEWVLLASLPSGFGHGFFMYTGLVGEAAEAGLSPMPAAGSRLRWFLFDELLVQFLALGVALLVFLEGGFLDRLARNRPLGVSGFFGACGGYCGRLARLWILTAPAYWWVFTQTAPEWRLVLLLPLNLLIDYAKVRAVVEDRRSAVGALLAALRFIRRHPVATVCLFGLNTMAFLAVSRLVEQIVGFAAGTWAGVGVAPPFAVALIGFGVVRLQFMASQIALFQSRLAHAGYTAAPPPKWPESPAAEAIRLMD